METETIKKLLDIGFKLSTWYDGKNSHPCLEYNLGIEDYELWIEYNGGYTLQGPDFQRDIKVNSILELEIIIKSLNNN